MINTRHKHRHWDLTYLLHYLHDLHQFCFVALLRMLQNMWKRRKRDGKQQKTRDLFDIFILLPPIRRPHRPTFAMFNYYEWKFLYITIRCDVMYIVFKDFSWNVFITSLNHKLTHDSEHFLMILLLNAL